MIYRFSLFFLLILLFSCAKDQPKVSWLKLSHWTLTTHGDAITPQGFPTNDLRVVFINMDGENLGTYELPAKIPIIGKGKHHFVMTPGIINNGISKTKVRYPFAEKLKVDITLKENDTVHFIPSTSYFANLHFLIEDFESPSMQIEMSSKSLGDLERGNDPSILKWGNKYGKIVLTDQDSMVMFVTTFGESFPKQGTDVYLEFDYINTNSMLTSLISYGNNKYFDDPFIQVNPQEENTAYWKHIYIDLTEDVTYRRNAPLNEVQFTLLKDDLGTNKYFYIDNIKIIYP